MRVFISPSLLFAFLSLFHLSSAADGTPKGEVEEDEVFWSRTLTSMSMSLAVGGSQAYFSSSGGMCNSSCKKNSDCNRYMPGGYNACTKCGKYVGARYYHQCYDPNTDDDQTPGPTPSPTPFDYFPDGGQCAKTCKKDKDCQKGGFNPCPLCGEYVGTLMYRRCYRPQEFTPAPTPSSTAFDYFPNAGQCGVECEKDQDCQVGGFNPCLLCGQYKGTLMYHRCYQEHP